MTTAGVSSAAYSCYNQYTETGTIDPVKVFWDTAKGVAVSYLTYVGMEWATGKLSTFCTEGAAAAGATASKDTKTSGDADGDGAATSNKKSKGNSTAPADVDENGNSNKNNTKSKNNQAANTGDVDNQQAENADSKSSGKGTNKAANKSGNEAPTTTTDGDEASKGNKGTSKNHETNTGDVDNQQAENTDSKSSGKNTNKAANKSTSEAPANTTDGNDAPKENKGTSKNHAANNADADNHQTEHTDSKSSGNGANKTTTKPANETPVATADGDDTHKTSSGSSKSQSTNKVNIEKQQVEGSNAKSTSSSTSKVANENHAPATGSGETSSHNGSSGAPGSHTTSGGNVEKQHVESTSTKTSSQSTSRTPSEVPVAPLDSDDISVGNKGTSKGDSTKSTVPKQNADINENVGMEQAKTTPEHEQHVSNVEETKVKAPEKSNQNQNTQKNTDFDNFDHDTASNMQKGNYGEHQAYENKVNNPEAKEKGYELNSMGRVPDDINAPTKQGIDGLYENQNKDSNIKYVIDEAKYNTSSLQKSNDGKQMSDSWITGSGNDASGDSRIYKALREGGYSEEAAAAEETKILKALKNGQVDRVLTQVSTDGTVTTYKLDSKGNKIKVDGKYVTWP
ncbi:hypothetical protein [Butyrivibrio proteoclasticus]|uniref:hypothetical protein n=1 Tax=Butyrivibrio proteoclasticus TaxID=43305 RepID=UPI000AEF51B8|nr:hypothetical protein [Butyrivibrio proteoclasticus]